MKTDHPDYYKDEKTGAVLNTNTGEYIEFVAKRNKIKELLAMKADIETLKAEVRWLKKELRKDG